MPKPTVSFASSIKRRVSLGSVAWRWRNTHVPECHGCRACKVQVQLSCDGPDSDPLLSRCTRPKGTTSSMTSQAYDFDNKDVVGARVARSENGAIITQPTNATRWVKITNSTHDNVTPCRPWQEACTLCDLALDCTLRTYNSGVDCERMTGSHARHFLACLRGDGPCNEGLTQWKRDKDVRLPAPCGLSSALLLGERPKTLMRVLVRMQHVLKYASICSFVIGFHVTPVRNACYSRLIYIHSIEPASKPAVSRKLCELAQNSTERHGPVALLTLLTDYHH